MKVALIYDRVNRVGGAERILTALHQVWPQAPLYTAVYDPGGAPWAKDFKVVPSFLQRFPGASRHHEFYGWLTPVAFESFDLSEFELVISVTSAEAKAVITRPETIHLCYCLTPTRYLWSDTWAHFKSYPFKSRLLEPVVKTFGPALTVPLRLWDQVAAQRPDHYLTISETARKRIQKYYRRAAKVIYPPVAVEKFAKKQSPTTTPPYFLVVSRLVPYKRVDLAVEAFNQLGLPLVVVGEGPEQKRLQKMAKDNVIMTGRLTEEQLIDYYRNCQALIFPAEEDFGLVTVEAQAAGKPVIAYRGGGALETVIEGRTGLFFEPQTTTALIGAVTKFKPEAFSELSCRRQAARFGKERFLKEFREAVADLVTGKKVIGESR